MIVALTVPAVRLSILYMSDAARRYKNQNEHNDDRQYSPRQFNLVASVDLRWLCRFIPSTLAVIERAHKQADQRRPERLLCRLRSSTVRLSLISWAGCDERSKDIGSWVWIANAGLSSPLAADPKGGNE